MFYASYKVCYATFSTHTFNISPFCPPVRLRFRPISCRNSIWLDRSFHCMVYLWIYIMFADFWRLLNINFVAIAQYRQYCCHRKKKSNFSFVCIYSLTVEFERNIRVLRERANEIKFGSTQRFCHKNCSNHRKKMSRNMKWFALMGTRHIYRTKIDTLEGEKTMNPTDKLIRSDSVIFSLCRLLSPKYFKSMCVVFYFCMQNSPQIESNIFAKRDYIFLCSL